MKYIFLVLFVIFGALNQILLKHLSLTDTNDFLTNPFFGGFILSFCLSFFFWIRSLKLFELSYAFLFISLSMVICIVYSIFFLNENLTVSKSIGIILIVIGLSINNLPQFKINKNEK